MNDGKMTINIARNDDYIIIPKSPIIMKKDGNRLYNIEYNLEFFDVKVDNDLYIQIVNILIDRYKENELNNCKVYKRVL